MNNGGHGHGRDEHKGQGDGNMGDGYIAIIMHRPRWGTEVIGHMGNGAHSGCIQ